MAATTCRMVDAGVDYLTVTTRAGGSTDELMEVGYAVGNDVYGGGTWEGKPWAALGYRGEKIGTIGYGSGDQGGIVQCSGGASTILAQRIAEAGINVRCTRIDFQVTGKWSRDCSAYARRTAVEIRKSEAQKAAHRPAKLEGRIGYGSGDTLTSGARSSERYIRIYDKTREQRGAVESNLWRWEVEFKRKLAARAWQLVTGAIVLPTLAEGIVVQEIERRGVTVPWLKGESIAVTGPTIGPSDVVRKLTWIRDQVMPTFVLLYREGYGDTLESMIAGARKLGEESTGESTGPGYMSEQ